MNRLKVKKCMPVTSFVKERTFKFSRVRAGFSIASSSLFFLFFLAGLFLIVWSFFNSKDLALEDIILFWILFLMEITALIIFGIELFTETRAFTVLRNDKLIINRDGFFYNRFSNDFIPWSEVENIERRKNGYVPVSVIFKNPEKFSSTWGTINPLLLKYRQSKKSYPQFKIIEESKIDAVGNADRAIFEFFERYKKEH